MTLHLLELFDREVLSSINFRVFFITLYANRGGALAVNSSNLILGSLYMQEAKPK